MARAGRKMKSGAREPNGQPQRPSSAGKQIDTSFRARQIDPGGLILNDQSRPAIYVITSDEQGLCKIGISGHPSRRLNTLQIGAFSTLRVFWASRLNRDDAIRLELRVHECLKKTSMFVRGEWFRIRPEDAVKIITSVADGLRMTMHRDPRFGIPLGGS